MAHGPAERGLVVSTGLVHCLRHRAVVAQIVVRVEVGEHVDTGGGRVSDEGVNLKESTDRGTKMSG